MKAVFVARNAIATAAAVVMEVMGVMEVMEVMDMMGAMVVMVIVVVMMMISPSLCRDATRRPTIPCAVAHGIVA